MALRTLRVRVIRVRISAARHRNKKNCFFVLMLENQPGNLNTDEEIARLVQSGDVEAFGILVTRYEAKLKRYGQKFLAGDRGAVEDAVQEAFLKAYKNIRDFDVSRKFSSWLYRIAHNELINVLKKKRLDTLFFFDTDVVFPHPVANGRTERQAERRLFAEIIEKCLDKLNPKYREPLVLYYFEELDYKEISDILHIPISTVGIRLKRGKEAAKLACQKIGYNL